MSEWIEFKVLRDGVISRATVDPYQIASFVEHSTETTAVNLENGDRSSTIVVAEPYKAVRKKVIKATTPNYTVNITTPNDDCEKEEK